MQTPTLIEWARRMFGLAPDIFSRCSNDMKWRCQVAIYGLLVLHGFSAFSIGLGLYATFHHPIVFLAAAVLFGALFTVDRLLLVGKRHWSSTLFRLLLAISLPVLNVGFFDLYAFEPDLRDQYQVNQAKRIEQQRRHYQVMDKDLQERKAALWDERAGLRDSLRIWERDVVEEASGEGGTQEKGKGPVFELQKERLQRLRVEAQEEIGEIEAELAALSDKASRLRNKQKSLAEQVQPYDTLGLASRLELLGEKMLVTKSWWMPMLSCLYLLMFVAFDGILLLPAVVAPFDEYREKAALNKKHLAAVQGFRDTQWRKYSAAQVQSEIERKLFALEQEAEVDRICAALRRIEERFQREVQMIERLRVEEEEKSAQWESQYRKMLQASVLRAMDAFEDLL